MCDEVEGELIRFDLLRDAETCSPETRWNNARAADALRVFLR